MGANESRKSVLEEGIEYKQPRIHPSGYHHLLLVNPLNTPSSLPSSASIGAGFFIFVDLATLDRVVVLVLDMSVCVSLSLIASRASATSSSESRNNGFASLDTLIDRVIVVFVGAGAADPALGEVLLLLLRRAMSSSSESLMIDA